jgi:hypothetical protein
VSVYSKYGIKIKKSRKHIANEINAPAAWITRGPFNSLVLAAAPYMVGKDPEAMRKLPLTENMKNEFIINTINRQPVDENVIIEQFKELVS